MKLLLAYLASCGAYLVVRRKTYKDLLYVPKEDRARLTIITIGTILLWPLTVGIGKIFHKEISQ